LSSFLFDCPLIPVITMVRLIAAFAFALVANADFICTSTPAAPSDCQCLSMVGPGVDYVNQRPSYLTLDRVWTLETDPTKTGQSDFTITEGAISFKFPDGQKKCVTHPAGSSRVYDMAPCDYESEGGFFVPLTTGRLLHVGKSTSNQPDECLEPNLVDPWFGALSVGECFTSWTISSTPQCSSTSEMVIS